MKKKQEKMYRKCTFQEVWVWFADYVGFIKKVMKQLQTSGRYTQIKKVDVDLMQLDESEAAPPSPGKPITASSSHRQMTNKTAKRNSFSRLVRSKHVSAGSFFAHEKRNCCNHNRIRCPRKGPPFALQTTLPTYLHCFSRLMAPGAIQCSQHLSFSTGPNGSHKLAAKRQPSFSSPRLTKLYFSLLFSSSTFAGTKIMSGEFLSHSCAL